MNRLSGGYVYAETDRKRGLRSVGDVSTGDRLRLYLAEGSLETHVDRVIPSGERSPEDGRKENR